MTRYSVCALLVIVGIAGQARAADQFVPLGLMGQWNGVYYYWCLICPTPASPPEQCYVTTNRMHALGVDCTVANDPIARKDVKRALGSDFGEVRPSTKSKLKEFVGKRKAAGAPGTGVGESDEHSGSIFCPESARVTVTADFVIRVRSKDLKREVYFRVLKVVPDPSKFAELTAAQKVGLKPFYVGLEMKPADVPASVTDAEYVDKIGDTKLHHKVKQTATGGEEFFYHVTTKATFEP